MEGDCVQVLKTLEAASVQCVVTSPPYYGLRDYDVEGQIGLEPSPEAYVEQLVKVFREVWRVLKDDGTLWLNLGDSYNGNKNGNTNGTYANGVENKAKVYAKSDTFTKKLWSGAKTKDLLGIPWMVAFALRADGWYLRSDIIWAKPNPMPESVRDRPTKSHEYIFLLTKSAHYFYDYQAILEPANYDGRKDTRMKGFVKYDEQTAARKGGERWPNKLSATGVGGDGSGFKGHSGNRDANGNIIGYKLPPIGGVKRAGGDNSTYSGNTPDAVYKDGVPARNKRDVWTVNTKPYKGAHFAVFPDALIEPCILAGSAKGDIVLDPFCGSGTTMAVAAKHGRNGIGIDLNPAYLELTRERLAKVQVEF